MEQQTEQKDSLQFLKLVVEAVELNNGRYVIKSGGRSYSFFEKKKDSTDSRAFTDYKTIGLQIGQTYDFGVSEAPGVAQDGTPIVYRNIRTIKPGQTAPQQTTQTPVNIQPTAQPQQVPTIPAPVVVEAPQQAPDTTPSIPTTEQQASEQTEIKVEDIPFN